MRLAQPWILLMLALLNAIYGAFTTNATLVAAFPGGLHRERAPEAALLPYVVSHVVSSTTEFAYGGAARSTTQVKFSAIAVGHDAAGLLAQTLAQQFDGALLTLSSGVNDSVVRHGEPTPALLAADGMGNDVWAWSVVYEYGVTA